MTLKCPFCGAEFATLWWLRRHVHSQHAMDYCPCCGRVVNTPVGLMRHASSIDDPCHDILYTLLSTEGTKREKRRRGWELIRKGYTVQDADTYTAPKRNKGIQSLAASRRGTRLIIRSFKIEEWMDRALARLAAEKRISKSALLREIIDDWLRANAPDVYNTYAPRAKQH